MKFNLPVPDGLGKKKEKPDYFLALILRDERATAIILKKEEGELTVSGEHEEYFETSIEKVTEQNFLETLDKAISTAEGNLPKDVETQKTIFGLKENWVEDEHIKAEYLEKLKKAGSELDLTPIGFVITNEAILSLLQKEEGAPVSAILTDIGKRKVTITLSKAGRVKETKSSEIHESASFTVDTLLKHLETPEILPSKVIILGQDDDKSQEFISHQWSKSLSFLHLPQIVNLPNRYDVKAMVYSTASQMGVSYIPDFAEIKDEENDIPKLSEDDKVLKEETKPEKITDDDPKLMSDNIAPADSFGFMEGEDISKAKPVPKAETQKAAMLAIDEEVRNEETARKIEEIPDTMKTNEENKNAIPDKMFLVFGLAKTTFGKVYASMSKLPLGGVKKAIPPALLPLLGQKFVLIPIVVIALLLFGFVFMTFASSATVNVTLKPEVVEETEEVVFTEDETDASKGIINAVFTSTTVDGELTQNATGKKATGDEAKGKVTIFNNSSSPVKLAKDSKIQSSNNLIFTLEKEVTVASASGDVFSGTKPGTVDVDVVAEKFGTEYNLPSNTKFTVGNNSSIAAKNDNAFSGGTKKDIIVVSEDDLVKLREDLQKKLEEEARNKAEDELDSDLALLPVFTDIEVEKATYSKKEDEEAKEVTLNATFNYQGIAYNKDDLLNYSIELFGSDKTLKKEDLELKPDNLTVEKNGDVSADLKIQAKLYPKIDTKKITKDVSGKSIVDAEDLVAEMDQVEDVRITVSPNIPLISKSLPRFSNNIKVVVNSQ